MKTYKCIDTKMLAGGKSLQIRYLMLEAIVKENQGQVNRAMQFQEIILFGLYKKAYPGYFGVQVIIKDYNLCSIQERKQPRWTL